MVQKFTQFFKQPFPYFQKKLPILVWVSLCIFIILVFAQGSNSQPNDIYTLTFYVVGPALITAGCTSIVLYLLPLVFKRFYDEKRWTRGKYFLFTVTLTLMIGLVNSLYYYCIVRNIYYNEHSFFKYLYHNLFIACLIGIIPITFGYFWLKNKDLSSDLLEKEDQNQKLMRRVRREKSASEKKLITLSSNTKDSLTLFPDELFYIESVGNYVQVYYRQNGQTSQKMLRATLSQMEEFLIEYPFFVRCHRAFLVNTCHIRKNNGNTLRLKGLKTAIPVSKASKINVQKRINSDDDSSQI